MCEIRAQPSVQMLYWIVDQNSTMLTTGQIIREYWTLVIVSNLLSANVYNLLTIIFSF